MIVMNSVPVVLLKAEQQSFKGRDGGMVEYVKATLLDDDGNKFECSIDSEAGDLVGKEKVEGLGKFAVFTSQVGGRSSIKLRLLGFTIS